MNKKNKLKHILRSGGTAFGSWLSLGQGDIAEIMSQSQCDFLTIDLEHSVIDFGRAQNLIRIIELSGPSPLIRISKNCGTEIKRVMDAGAHGVIVPMISSKKEAEKVVSSVYYAPQGERGVGLSRAQGYGAGFNAYREWLHQEAVIITQIESQKAVENIHEILSIQAIDGVLIGPYDLSSSLGVSGNLNHPSVLNAEEKVLKACREHHKAAGIHIVHPDQKILKQKKDMGYRLIVYGSDMIFLSEAVRTHLSFGLRPLAFGL